MKALALSVLLAIGTAVYPADAAPAFEVASIKFHDLYNGDIRPPGATISGNKVTVLNFPLLGLITNAYDMKPYQVSGGPS
jgi:uncharacterized protein (TIGR03435 family)